MVILIVNEGEIKLNLADQSSFEETLRLELNHDLSLLELGHCLSHQFDEDVTVKVTHCGGSDIFEFLGDFFLRLHGNLADDIHDVLTIYLEILRLLDKQMQSVIACLHLTDFLRRSLRFHFLAFLLGLISRCFLLCHFKSTC